jgi:hypothetical protein
MFTGCNSLQNTSCLFKNCTLLGQESNITTSFPNALFDSCRNTLEDVSSMFLNCYKLNSVLTSASNNGKGLFTDCVNLRSTNSFFNRCVRLRGNVPSDMFTITNEALKTSFDTLTDISMMFSGCASLAVGMDGATSNGIEIDKVRYLVSPNLLDNCPNIINASYLFNSMRMYPPLAYDSDGNEGVPLVFGDNQYVELTEMDLKDYKAEIVTIPPELFDNKPYLEDISYCFNAIPYASVELDSHFAQAAIETGAL